MVATYSKESFRRKGDMIRLVSSLAFIFLPLLCSFYFSTYSIYISGFHEVISELTIVAALCVIIIKFKTEKDPLNGSLAFLALAFGFLAVADFLYIFTAEYTEQGNPEVLYFRELAYLFFIILFALSTFLLFAHIVRDKASIFIFIGLLAMFSILTYHYLFIPYVERPYHDPILLFVSLSWMVARIFMLALISTVSLRINNESIQAYSMLIFFLFIFDIAMTYQSTSSGVINAFSSLLESGWEFSVSCLACLIVICRIFPKQLKFEHAPYNSIRVLVVPITFTALCIFMFALHAFGLVTAMSAIDITVWLLVFGLVFLVSNFTGIFISKKIYRVGNILHEISVPVSKTSFFEYINLKSRLYEIDRILSSYNILVGNANRLVKEISTQSSLASIALTAAQVAHDIRSPLLALTSMTSMFDTLPEDQRIRVRTAIQRINDIANDLSRKKIDHEAQALEDEYSVYLLSGLIEILVTEKRMQYRARCDLNIETKLGLESYGVFAKIRAKEFKRVLSNVINNAVDALKDKGDVIISMERDDLNARIICSDNGEGIPADVLPKLMQKGASFGKADHKESGSGFYFKIIIFFYFRWREPYAIVNYMFWNKSIFLFGLILSCHFT
ncbi:MAG: HAMP domain-containing histidine kinase, partial [Deltaproteobacteria bacterium]|nr:HAMP domain-containing histidine kinase [Deltaproteobacteria bacterium]